MKITLKKLEELGQQWLDYSLKTNGWKSTTYNIEKGSIWCYFASEQAHTSVSFERIDISYFQPPKINIAVKELDEIYLSNIIEKYSTALDLLKKETEKETEQQIQQRKEKIKANLQEQLAQLEKS